MPRRPRSSATEAIETATGDPAAAVYEFRLCVSGMSPRSLEAIRAIRAICDEYLPGRHSLEIIDIYQHPELARRHDIVATPTLIKAAPAPLKRLLGTLRDLPETLVQLGIFTASRST